MTLEHGILGFLSHKPATGYDLKKQLDTTGARFWTAEHPQIYKALKTLESRGWIAVKEICPGKKRDKKVYELTPEGSRELICWLKQEDYSTYRMKNPIVMQCFFSGSLTLDDRILLLNRYYRSVKQQNRIFSDCLKKESREPVGGSAEDWTHRLSLHQIFRYSMMSSQTLLKWLRLSLKELQEERKTLRRTPSPLRNGKNGGTPQPSRT